MLCRLMWVWVFHLSNKLSNSLGSDNNIYSCNVNEKSEKERWYEKENWEKQNRHLVYASGLSRKGEFWNLMVCGNYRNHRSMTVTMMTNVCLWVFVNFYAVFVSLLGAIALNEYALHDSGQVKLQWNQVVFGVLSLFERFPGWRELSHPYVDLVYRLYSWYV